MELLGSTIAVDDRSRTETDSPFDSLKQSARLECYAAMQLLAERAAFLIAADGVGIAVIEGGKFVYCATAGNDVPAVGSVADCLPNGGTGSRLVVSIKSSEGLTSGFFELASKQKFRDQDSQEITRMADLASVAVEHLQAAERAEPRAERARFLAEAVDLINKAEHGRLRGLIDLGIVTKNYTDAEGNLIGFVQMP